MRRLARHPLALIAGAIILIGGTGALIDSLGGSSGEGAAVCGSAPAATGAQERAARNDFLSIWTRASRFLGSAGQPPPRFEFVGEGEPKPVRAPMWTGPDEDNCRAIFSAPGATRLLARSRGSRRALRHHRAAERWTLHEMAHYFQADAVLGDTPLAEFGATQWEKAHSRQVLGTSKRKKQRARYNEWRDRKQFGPNFGGNPLTFTWPSGSKPPS